MNAPTPIKPSAGIEAFHRERSRCIDAFAAAEAAVVRLLHGVGELGGTKPLAIKIAALCALKPSQNHTEKRKAIIDKALQNLQIFLVIRADIVHSRMQVVEIDGINHARFINGASSVQPFPQCRMLRFDEMRELTRRVEDIAGQLETA